MLSVFTVRVMPFQMWHALATLPFSSFSFKSPIAVIMLHATIPPDGNARPNPAIMAAFSGTFCRLFLV